MTDAMQTIREALAMIAVKSFRDEALAALDSLAVTPSEDASEFIDTTLSKSWDRQTQRYDRAKLSALIQARDERIRRECAKNAIIEAHRPITQTEIEMFANNVVDANKYFDTKLEAAILIPEATNGQ